MIAVEIRFLAGRYHATPWGRHANEGVVEWPPSPWRLLRALVATWYRTFPGGRREDLASLLAHLAEAPLVHLPAGVPAHTRHFMPWFKRGPEDRTQVLDSFVAVRPEDPVTFAWPLADLSTAETELLAALLRDLTYLGRAESWCAAILTEPPPAYNCRPLGEGEVPPPGYEAVRVLAPASLPPADLLEALLVDTEDLRTRNRRLDPPGSRWVTYAREASTLVPHPLPVVRSRPRPGIVAARYALDAKPLPLVTEAVAVGELARRAAMAQYGRHNEGRSSPLLSGREGREPMKGHRHAFYLPSDEDGDGRIDHLTVYVPAGLGEEEQHALARLSALRDRTDAREIRLLLLGLLTEQGLWQAAVWCKSATVWESATPYVLTRHPKVYRDGRPKRNDRGDQIDGPADQVRREWAVRREQVVGEKGVALPELVAVDFTDGYDARGAGRTFRWLQFRRWRDSGGGTTTGLAYGLRLTFSGPVAGPLALGYACHYGLGQFRPVTD